MEALIKFGKNTGFIYLKEEKKSIKIFTKVSAMIRYCNKNKIKVDVIK